MTDHPKTWGEMTYAEKWALMMAHHEGKPIDWFTPQNDWWPTRHPSWASDRAYRVRPEPKRETVTPDELAQIIRTVDGSNTLGAGELAEKILCAIR